jgi:molybdate/tungstate transport system substrate-binding protein
MTKIAPLVAMAALLGILVAGCGSSGGDSTGGGGDGTVNVLYAGSLVAMMENDLGPAFEGATGNSFRGYGGGSTELAQQIKGKVRQGDVFISASAAADEALEGAENGEWVSWYTNFAEAQLVIGYNPDSDYAYSLKSKNWYEAIS